MMLQRRADKLQWMQGREMSPFSFPAPSQTPRSWDQLPEASLALSWWKAYLILRPELCIQLSPGPVGRFPQQGMTSWWVMEISFYNSESLCWRKLYVKIHLSVKDAASCPIKAFPRLRCVSVAPAVCSACPGCCIPLWPCDAAVNPSSCLHYQWGTAQPACRRAGMYFIILYVASERQKQREPWCRRAICFLPLFFPSLRRERGSNGAWGGQLGWSPMLRGCSFRCTCHIPLEPIPVT